MEDTTEKCIAVSLGRTISDILLTDDVLTINFVGGGSLILEDKGQECCENRHMSTDDSLDYYKGSELIAIRLESGPDTDEGYYVHEQQFLHVQTSKGFVTVVNHNEHNGYYGGFSIRASAVAGKPVL
jgi:hypothetical protein